MKKINKDIQLRPYHAVELEHAQQLQIRDWGHKRMRANAVYHRTKGERAIIFVVDTGVPQHEDLQSRKFADLARNFTDSDTLYDLEGHATHCAGIAAADDNEVGVIGIAPSAEIVGVKTLDDTGAGASAWWHTALRYLADLDIAGGYKKVISMSYGTSRSSKAGEAAVNYALKKGCFLIAAAGNSGQQEGDTVNYPGAYPNVLTIASLNKTGGRSWFSSRGPAVDLIAPGHSIFSCGLNNTYVRLSGTSMATPAVAGAVALLVSAFPQIDHQSTLMKIIEIAATDWGDKGEDVESGHGEIFLDALFATADAYFAPPMEEEEPDPPTPPRQRYFLIGYDLKYLNGKSDTGSFVLHSKNFPSWSEARRVVTNRFNSSTAYREKLRLREVRILSVSEVPADFVSKPAPDLVEETE